MGNNKNMIQLNAYAKINLSLYITGLRDDGYHLLDSVFVPINLYDNIELKKSSDGIKIKCNEQSLLNKSNTAYKAAQLIMNEYKHIEGVEINIEKNIPAMAGLGGGSSDAAATLVGMNKLFNLSMDNKTLRNMAVKVGADVPFFLGKGASRVQGIGDIITPVIQKKKLHIVLIKPILSLSTPEVYKKYDEIAIPYRGDCNSLIDSLNEGDIYTISKYLKNDLQQAALEMCSEVYDSINYLLDSGALNAIMTGSGSCVFGVFENADIAKRTTRNYTKSGKAYYTTTIETPVQIL